MISSSPRDKNRTRESSCLMLVQNPLDSALPPKMNMSFLSSSLHPPTHSPTLYSLQGSTSLSLTLHTLWTCCGPSVHRLPCLYYVGFLANAISSPITREIKPAVEMMLFVFYSPLLAIKSQKLFSQKGLLQAHTRTMQGEGRAMPPHPPTEQATSQFKSEPNFYSLNLKITCIR